MVTVASRSMASKRVPVDLITMPVRRRPPLNAVGRRLAFAIGLLVFTALVVYIGRDGYTDTAGGSIGFFDALYYASVTVTTTGYGDISAVTGPTRLAALLLITPARIMFLILVVGTTVEVLTERSRQLMLTQRWRRQVKDHHVICGYGSTGEAAAIAVLAQGVDQSAIVVVDTVEAAVASAAEGGFTAVLGDASRVAVLRQAAVEHAAKVIVTPNRDDTAVLVTLTARELNPAAQIVVAVRERENLHLLRQSGADAVIDSSAAVGRLLGLATHTPSALEVVNDLLDTGTSLELAELAPERGGDGRFGIPPGSSIVEVLRDGERLPAAHPDAATLLPTDRLVVMRYVQP